MGTAGSKGPQGEGDGNREYDGHGVSPGAGRDGFMTVSKAKSPDAERQESAEGVCARYGARTEQAFAVVKRGSSVRSTPSASLGLGGGRATTTTTDLDGDDERRPPPTSAEPRGDTGGEQGAGGVGLEAAFAALAKWYARQATLVTRQQLALHEEIDEVSYMAKLAVQGVTGNRDALRQAVKDVQGLEAVAREISQLRAAVTSAAEAQRRLEAVVDEAERSGALGTPG